MNLLSKFFVKCDAPSDWQLGLQDPATPVMEGLRSFHDDLVFVMVIVAGLVITLLTVVLLNFNKNKNPVPSRNTHNVPLEIIWTLTPCFILASIVVPSLSLLYAIEDTVDPKVTVKVIGNQWYWTYHYVDYEFPFPDPDYIGLLKHDSYMIQEADLKPGELRLLETDDPLVLPTHTHIRLIMTAEDVIHSWAVPSFGVKLDCIPGRINEVSIFIKRQGAFYGQCSEICGVNHGFMPIHVEAISKANYDQMMDRMGLLMEKKFMAQNPEKFGSGE
uniref:Cytochrome c oxidase subunit 2 n=1 Tax=Palpitomonas bilix TaxID=652834 RepID=A0A1E1GHR9_9EUKA|nr:cytochrome c oxidase subunit 2 [Palpitomonas bilix]BAV82405.1 cytochrome c oxidase subunit 2 [Palpitomonas bilix]